MSKLSFRSSSLLSAFVIFLILLVARISQTSISYNNILPVFVLNAVTIWFFDFVVSIFHFITTALSSIKS